MNSFNLLLLVILVVVSVLAYWYFRRARRAQREHYIRTLMFPAGLLNRLLEKHEDLDLKDRQLVARALRQFFLVYLHSGFRPIAMPSRLVDELWHEFILYTHHYQDFCRQAFGRYLHHTPAAVLGNNAHGNAHLRRTWWYACLEENINPRKATRLPLLFAIDQKYQIEGGYFYQTHCDKKRGASDPYCASDFYPDSHSSDGASVFSFDDASSSSWGDGGSGDSGSSCSGGCGGD